MLANANQEQAVRKVENQLLARARIGAELLARQGWCHGGACTKPAAFGASDRGFARNGPPINRHQGGVSGSCTKLAASGAPDRGFAQKGHPINRRAGGLSGPWLALGVASWRGLSRRGLSPLRRSWTKWIDRPGRWMPGVCSLWRDDEH